MVTGESTQHIPAESAQHTVESLYAEHGAQRPWIYWFVLIGVIGALASLPLIKVDVSVSAAGQVRPTTERVDLRSAVSGNIAQMLARDNDRVRAGQPLLVLHSRDLDERLARNQALRAGHAAFIADLKNLTEDFTDITDEKAAASSVPSAGATMTPVVFQTAALRQEHAQFLAQADSHRLAEARARKELTRYTTLASKGIATQQEHDNARHEADRLQAESRFFVEQTLGRWQSRLREERITQADLV